jgi:hypothetical protein
MAHWIQYMSGSAKKFVGPTSRYINSKLIHYTEDKKITFETYKRERRIVTGREEWLEITKQVEYRPDLVAEEIYGTSDLWWSIMEFNGMKDILEFKAGVNIKLPGNIMA